MMMSLAVKTMTVKSVCRSMSLLHHKRNLQLNLPLSRLRLPLLNSRKRDSHKNQWLRLNSISK